MATSMQRRAAATIGALSLHAAGGTDTAPARAAFIARFERIVDPTGSLDPAERSRRAEFAKRAHFVRLAAKSAAARRERR